MASREQSSGEARALTPLSPSTLRAGDRNDLLTALQNIKSAGSFAHGAGLVDALPVKVTVDGVGDIDMPLTEAQARQMIAQSRQAPYGKGSETLVDTSVRNTFELDPSQFTLDGDEWHHFLRRLCARVATDLGIEGVVKPDLYKMLVYEKGAMFKAHTDTEKIPGMFGTLVICLPSEHKGGDVVLKHCGQKRVIKSSMYKQSYGCWYSDVTHEVLPVQSGYRWVLTYNLALDGEAERPTAALERSKTRALRHALRRWLDENPSPAPGTTPNREYKVVHVLDHDYTEANLSFKTLKARDLAQVHALKDLSNELPYEIFLALLEKEQFGTVEHNFTERYASRFDDHYEEEDPEGPYEIEDVLEENYSITHLVDLQGKDAAECLSLQEEDLLEPDAFDDIDRDREEYEGFMGNSGPSAKHWYHWTAVVLVPRDRVFGFLRSGQDYGSEGERNTRSQLEYWLRKRRQSPQNDSYPSRALERLCEITWEDKGRYRPVAGTYIGSDTILEILKVSVAWMRYPFLKKLFTSHTRSLPLNFFSWLRDFLANGPGKEETKKRLDALRECLYLAVRSYKSLSDQSSAILGFCPVPDTQSYKTLPHAELFLAWAHETIDKCLDKLRPEILGVQDGEAPLVFADFHCESKTSFLFESVVPRVQSQTEAPAFQMAFLVELVKFMGEQGDEPADHIRSSVRKIAEQLITSIKFDHLTSSASPEEPSAKRPTGAPKNGGSNEARVVYPKFLADFLKAILLLDEDGGELLHLVATKLIRKSTTFPASEFYPLWLPFLRVLLRPASTSWTVLNDATSKMQGKSFIQRVVPVILKSYLDKVVGREPTPIPYNGPSLGCTCRDCQDLNTFLADATQRIGNFAVNTGRRFHLHQQIEVHGIRCTHETRRDRYPETLVVTKLFQQVDTSRKGWISRLKDARQQMQQFDQALLAEALGPDYHAFVDLSYLGANIPLRPMESNSTASRRSPVTGQKRKAAPTVPEIIDLTDG